MTFATSALLTMLKKLRLIFIPLFCLFNQTIFAQEGLEDVYVERYYVSSAADTLASALHGKLPIGSVTYRVYLDLKPGYRFYAAFGMPGHELRIATTTTFFNNERNGQKIPNVIPHRSMRKGTVMLDSWLSAGAAAEDFYAVPKIDDDTVNTILAEGNYLKNSNKKMGPALSEVDGLKEIYRLPFPVLYGIDSVANIFLSHTKGNLFSTENGAWGCLGGSTGLDSLGTNRVLIGQFTTDGEFSFKLNVQIGTRGQQPVLYVAENARENEILFSKLNYNSSVKEKKVRNKSKHKSDKTKNSNKKNHEKNTPSS